jgi:tetratricopeptide (TPR) repeat protein
MARPVPFGPFLIIVLLFFSLTSYSTLLQEEGTLDQLLADVDRYSQETFEHEKALTLLLDANEAFPDNEAVLWRISRSYADSAEVLQHQPEKDEDTILGLYETARDYADRAIEVNPSSSMAYTRRAIATGQIALYKGIWSAVDLVKQTRDAVEKAVELDNENSIAHFVLGRTHAEVSQRPRIVRAPLGLGWANINRAIEHFDIAIALRPEYIRYRLDAARALVREKKHDRAEALLENITELPTHAQLDYLYRQQALDLLEELKSR